MTDPCGRTRSALLEHPPWDPRVEAHCTRCADCEAVRAEALSLRESALRWREQTPGPPADLRDRIAQRLGEVDVPGSQTQRDLPPRRLRWVAAAAAVIVLVGAFLTWFAAPTREEGPEAALADAEAARDAYMKAIARLARQADAVLVRAEDPDTPPRRAAVLIGYRDRLSYLDEVIGEVDRFLREHPGHAGGHTVLLAAYKEKTEVLEQVLDLVGEQS